MNYHWTNTRFCIFLMKMIYPMAKCRGEGTLGPEKALAWLYEPFKWDGGIGKTWEWRENRVSFEWRQRREQSKKGWLNDIDTIVVAEGKDQQLEVVNHQQKDMSWVKNHKSVKFARKYQTRTDEWYEEAAEDYTKRSEYFRVRVEPSAIKERCPQWGRRTS